MKCLHIHLQDAFPPPIPPPSPSAPSIQPSIQFSTQPSSSPPPPYAPSLVPPCELSATSWQLCPVFSSSPHQRNQVNISKTYRFACFHLLLVFFIVGVCLFSLYCVPVTSSLQDTKFPSRTRREVSLILPNCSDCITKTSRGRYQQYTLLHTNIPPEKSIKTASCLHQQTQYDIYKDSVGKYWCSSPTVPVLLNVTVYAGRGDQGSSAEGSDLRYVNNTVIYYSSSLIPLYFDACVALGIHAWGKSCGSNSWIQSYKDSHKYLCKANIDSAKGNPQVWLPCAGRTDCSGWQCVCFYTGGGYSGSECPDISEFRRGQGNMVELLWKPSKTNKIASYGFGIDGVGSDPITYITIIQSITKNITKSTWSVLQKLEQRGDNKDPALDIPKKATNMFVRFAETVAKTLNIKNCFVCGGTNSGEQWPWGAVEVSSSLLMNLSASGNVTKRTQVLNLPLTWLVTSDIIGQSCFTQNVTNGPVVGWLQCLGQWENGVWTSAINMTAPPPYNFINLLSNVSGEPWTTPSDMYWICGNMAYQLLPANWVGSCVLGFIRPSFFLVPLPSASKLGVRVYDTYTHPRSRRELLSGIGGIEVVGSHEEIWTSERIVAYYDPATWAQDGSWGYRTPIYMLNRIIRLQHVLELAGRNIDKALNIIATEQDKLRTAVYQNRLALDYLLASEGGVCGKFNLSNCCLRINQVGDVVRDLTDDLRRVIHVPAQRWTGVLDQGFLGGLFRNWKQAALMAGVVIVGLMLLPCLIPLIKTLVQNAVNSALTNKQALFMQMEKAPLIKKPCTLSSGEDGDC